MRRKLISFDAFQNIEKKSLTNAAYELSEASTVLADLLESGDVGLHCYDSENVYYTTGDDSFIHASYKIEDGLVKLENISEVLIDDDSHHTARKAILASMVEAVSSQNEDKARHLFNQFTEMHVPKMKYMKGRRAKSPIEKRVSNDKSNLMKGVNEGAIGIQGTSAKDAKKRAAALKGHRLHPRQQEEGWKKRRSHKTKIQQLHNSPNFKLAKKKADRIKATGNKRARVQGQRIAEWNEVGTNVLVYVEHATHAPAMQELKVQRDRFDNLISVSIPTTQVRNEGKLLALKWDTLKTDVKVIREQAMRLSHDEAFQEAVSVIKRMNNLSSEDQLAENLNTLVATYPSVLYLSQSELSKTIAEALHHAGTSNYDDSICDFIAEGILRVAFEAYPERVSKLSNLAQVGKVNEGEDAYVKFQSALEEFLPTVDEQFSIQMKVFADLHEALMTLRDVGEQFENNALLEDASNYLVRIEDVLNGHKKPTLSLAEEVGAYLKILAETNLGMKAWDVEKVPYRTTVGEHPAMIDKARHSYAPAKDLSDEAEGEVFVSDGGKLIKDRDNRWTSMGGSDVYPNISNPYMPKSGDWTMKGEKGVDKGTDDSLGQWQSNDTWPTMDNPYIPKTMKKFVNNDNRVDDVENKVGLKNS